MGYAILEQISKNMHDSTLRVEEGLVLGLVILCGSQGGFA